MFLKLTWIRDVFRLLRSLSSKSILSYCLIKYFSYFSKVDESLFIKFSSNFEASLLLLLERRTFWLYYWIKSTYKFTWLIFYFSSNFNSRPSFVFFSFCLSIFSCSIFNSSFNKTSFSYLITCFLVLFVIWESEWVWFKTWVIYVAEISDENCPPVAPIFDSNISYSLNLSSFELDLSKFLVFVTNGFIFWLIWLLKFFGFLYKNWHVFSFWSSILTKPECWWVMKFSFGDAFREFLKLYFCLLLSRG